MHLKGCLVGGLFFLLCFIVFWMVMLLLLMLWLVASGERALLPLMMGYHKSRQQRTLTRLLALSLGKGKATRFCICSLIF